MARVMLSVKSGPSRKACYLRFINRTLRKVNVIWIDYNGFTRNYGTLDPTRHFDIHTYEGHPWICEDSVTMTRMLLNKSEIFYPLYNFGAPARNLEPNGDGQRCYLPVLNDPRNHLVGIGWSRQRVFITLPG